MTFYLFEWAGSAKDVDAYPPLGSLPEAWIPWYEALVAKDPDSDSKKRVRYTSDSETAILTELERWTAGWKAKVCRHSIRDDIRTGQSTSGSDFYTGANGELYLWAFCVVWRADLLD